MRTKMVPILLCQFFWGHPVRGGTRYYEDRFSKDRYSKDCYSDTRLPVCAIAVEQSPCRTDFTDYLTVHRLSLLNGFTFVSVFYVVLARYCYRMSSVCPSVTLMYAEHVGWTSSKLITRIISLGSSLVGARTSAI